jgi:hypothetical protein
MRSISRIVASSILLLPLLSCGPSQPATDQAPVVASFSEGTSAAGQARHAQEAKARTDLEECRKMRQQGVYPRERHFPCEGFLGD